MTDGNHAKPGQNPAGPAPSLEERKHDLERQRLALEASFPRKWGSVIFGVAGTIAVALITQTYSFVQQQAESTRKQVEIARSALEIYFRNLEAMDPKKSERAIHHMKLVAAVSGEPGVQELFASMWTDELGRRLDASRPAANGVTPSDVARGLPDLVQKTVGDKYKASDFIAYIQFPEGKRPLAQQMADALRGLGMRTPGIEERKANSPLKSQIRYYKPAHAAVAREIAARLKERTGIEFETRLLSNIGRLPDGIIEFWLGTS